MYLSLHIGDPKENGLVPTEVEYEGYERVCLDGAPFCFEGTNLVNVNAIAFPMIPCGSDPVGPVSHFAFIEEPSGPSRIAKVVPIEFPLTLLEHAIPQFSAGAIRLYAIVDQPFFASAN